MRFSGQSVALIVAGVVAATLCVDRLVLYGGTPVDVDAVTHPSGALDSGAGRSSSALRPSKPAAQPPAPAQSPSSLPPPPAASAIGSRSAAPPIPSTSAEPSSSGAGTGGGRVLPITAYMLAHNAPLTVAHSLQSWADTGLLASLARTVVFSNGAALGIFNASVAAHKVGQIFSRDNIRVEGALLRMIEDATTPLIMFLERDFVVCPAAAARAKVELEAAVALLQRGGADMVLLRSSIDPGPPGSHLHKFCPPDGLQLWRAVETPAQRAARWSRAWNWGDNDVWAVGASSSCFEHQETVRDGVWTACDPAGPHYCYSSMYAACECAPRGDVECHVR